MKVTRKYSWLLLLAVLAAMNCKKSNNDNNNNNGPSGPVEIKDSVIVNNLSYPWEIIWGPDNHIWVTERGGKISRINPATGAVIPLLTITEVSSMGEGGLLGMAIHPKFSTSPHVFVVYNYYDNTTYKEKVVRYTYSGGTLNSPQTIVDNIAANSIHNGSRLVITPVPDLKLFITTGDAGNTSTPQNPSSRNGKVLRVNLDGTIPGDNPVAGNAYWSIGHRNPQGLVFANDRLYSAEHGPSNDDEVNIIAKGRNYGWPSVEGFCNTTPEQTFCSANNVIEPLKNWTPTAAVAGMDYYNSDLIPQWKNSLLLVALKNARLYQLKLDGTFNAISETNEFFTNKYGRMRDVCVSPEGKVYICTSNGLAVDKLIEISKK